MKECVCVDKMSEEAALKMAIYGLVERAGGKELRLLYIATKNIVKK